MQYTTLKIENHNKLTLDEIPGSLKLRTNKIQEFTKDNGFFIIESQRGVGVAYSISQIYPKKKNLFLLSREELSFITEHEKFMDIKPFKDNFICLDITIYTKEEIEIDKLLNILSDKGFKKIIILCSIKETDSIK